jgi:non-homologous end joining protein Ku
MAARATGSGTISFGLVAVQRCSTVDTTNAIRFNYLGQDGSRLEQQYIRASEGKVIEPGDKVQGYEFQRAPKRKSG